jgi:RecJ-like exonuclease
MPSGLDGWVAHPEFLRELDEARELVRAHPGRWRIIYHYDGDGIASASAAIRALQRLGYPFHATPFVGVQRDRMAALLARTKGPALVVDTGASWLDVAGQHPAPVVVLDHHTYPGMEHPAKLPQHVRMVNPLDWGVDGMSELSAASLTWLFSIHLDARNWDNAPWGLSGAIADRQHIGGLRGLNRRLADGAIERSLLEPRRGLLLTGPTVAEALARSVDPYIRGLSGRMGAVKSLLVETHIGADQAPLALSSDESQALSGAVRARLESQEVRPEFLEVVDQEDWRIPSLGLSATELSNLQNATGRESEPGVGIALALGDAEALKRARGAEERWRSGLLNGLRRLEEGGVNGLPHVQWFESPETTLAGTQAGLAMTYLLDPSRPVFVFSTSVDGRVLKVSGRGTLYLVSRGLDLATVFRSAAADVGGEGGGHRVASGATIPLEARDRFLASADALVGQQLPSPGAGA